MARRPTRTKPRAPSQSLPAHPRGKRWNPRHIIAASLRGQGKDWPEIAAACGVRLNTAQHYPALCPGWDVLLDHYRSRYLAELEDELVAPALQVLKGVMEDQSQNVFARIQAAQTVLAERQRKVKSLEGLMQREERDATTSRKRDPVPVDVTITDGEAPPAGEVG